MKAAGYDYPDPRRSINDPAVVTPEPTAAEIAVAVADVAGKEQVNLVNVWATVEIAYQQRALERNAEALADIKRAFDTSEQNAAKILNR